MPSWHRQGQLHLLEENNNHTDCYVITNFVTINSYFTLMTMKKTERGKKMWNELINDKGNRRQLENRINPG